jgi:hypothetical protein
MMVAHADLLVSILLRWKEVTAILTDPLALTINSVSVNLARVSVAGNEAIYRSSDGVYEMYISQTPGFNRRGTAGTFVNVELTQFLVDSTDPAFTQERFPSNSFVVGYFVDSIHSNTTTDVPLLRTALLAFVDSTIQGRLFGGEK